MVKNEVLKTKSSPIFSRYFCVQKQNPRTIPNVYGIIKSQVVNLKLWCLQDRTTTGTKLGKKLCRDVIDGVKNNEHVKVKRYVFYIAQYPVRLTAQSALHFSSPGRPVHSDTNSASRGMLQLRNDYSLTFTPLSIAKYSFIQLNGLRRREENENARTSKRYQRGFEPGLSRLRFRHYTTVE